jgi:GntR family transcriptional regulator
MQIRISTADGVPIYLQIVNQVKQLLSSGRLEAGEEMPPIRVLAGQLLINPNTVARAYLELERAGIVTKRHGSGTFVSDGGSPLARRQRIKILTDRANSLLTEAEHLGVELNELIDLLRQQHKAMKSNASI